MSLLTRRHSSLGTWHPRYLQVLDRATGAGYAFPTMDCLMLQNQLFKSLDFDGVLNLLDYLYLYAHNSGDNNFSRINAIQPLKALATGTPTYVSKKGIYGTQTNDGFNIATDKVAMTGANNSSEFVWLTENGGTISVSEFLVEISGANARSQGIRLRTNPRVDSVFNQTSASAFTVYNAFPLDNHFYHVDYGEIASVGHLSVHINGVTTIDTFPSSAGILPDTGLASTRLIDSSRAVGVVGGGASIYQTGKQVLLYNAISAYMTAVQALP